MTEARSVGEFILLSFLSSLCNGVIIMIWGVVVVVLKVRSRVFLFLGLRQCALLADMHDMH
jgi:hypothetical protein